MLSTWSLQANSYVLLASVFTHCKNSRPERPLTFCLRFPIYKIICHIARLSAVRSLRELICKGWGRAFILTRTLMLITKLASFPWFPTSSGIRPHNKLKLPVEELGLICLHQDYSVNHHGSVVQYDIRALEVHCLLSFGVQTCFVCGETGNDPLMAHGRTSTCIFSRVS